MKKVGGGVLGYAFGELAFGELELGKLNWANLHWAKDRRPILNEIQRSTGES